MRDAVDWRSEAGCGPNLAQGDRLAIAGLDFSLIHPNNWMNQTFFFSFSVPLTPQSETKNKMSLFPSHYEVPEAPSPWGTLNRVPVLWAAGMAFFPTKITRKIPKKRKGPGVGGGRNVST